MDARTGSHRLVVVQQPMHARMCGFGEKDRRPVDPPPIIQVVKDGQDGSLEEKPPLGHFVLHVSLWSADGKSECNVIVNPPKSTRILMGSVVATPERLRDEKGKLGDFACFPDLSIRTEGTYTLKFGLMMIDSDMFFHRGGMIIATVLTAPFVVYPAKKFPGMTESTRLSKLFRKQGMNIPIRNSIRPRKLPAPCGKIALKTDDHREDSQSTSSSPSTEKSERYASIDPAP